MLITLKLMQLKTEIVFNIFIIKNFDEMIKAGNKAIEIAPNDAKVLGRICYLPFFICFVRLGMSFLLKEHKSSKLIVNLKLIVMLHVIDLKKGYELAIVIYCR